MKKPVTEKGKTKHRISQFSVFFFIVFLPLHLSLHNLQVMPVSFFGAYLYSAVLSFGAGSLSVLLLQNLHRLKTVMRPTTGRIVSTVFMVLLTPVKVLGVLPIFFMSMLTDPDLSSHIFSVFGVFLICVSFWYLVASLIIFGVHNMNTRIGLFWLEYWGVHSAVALFVGRSSLYLLS